MATFLDLSLFEHVSSLFIFTLVFLIVYAFLGLTKVFKDMSGQNAINAILALAIAFLASFSQGFVTVITTMTPWFVVIIIFLFLSFFVTRMFTTDDTIFENLLKGPVKWVLVIIFVIILLVSISSSFGQQTLDATTGGSSTNTGTTVSSGTSTTTTSTTSTSGSQTGVATDDFSTNVTQTLFHPKVLGMLLVILIAFFTILLLSKTPDAPGK